MVKSVTTRGVKSDERWRYRRGMKRLKTEQRGSAQQTHREARIYRTGDQMEQNSATEHSRGV